MSGVTDTIAAARILREGGAAPTARQLADALGAVVNPEPDDQGSSNA